MVHYDYVYSDNIPSLKIDRLGLWAPGWEGGQAGANWGVSRFSESNTGINSCYSKCPANAPVRKRGNCCEYRTENPKSGYTPSSNGCGSEGGTKVPDSGKGVIYIPATSGCAGGEFDTRYYKLECEFNFLAACNDHDICYGTCGNSKSECDNRFLQAMIDSCSRNKTPNSYYACTQIAYIYYQAVNLLGGSAYLDAQDEACEWAPCK